MLEKRVNYWQAIQQIRAEDLVFIDEAGVNLAMTRLYARALRGQRATATQPSKRGRNITMVGAILRGRGFANAMGGVVTALTYEGATDGLAFKTFVEKALVPNLWAGACVVMDNYSSHKVQGVQTLIESAQATLIYLPPYSPDFSPIENFWSKVKQYIRSTAARTYETLDEAITEAFDAVSLTDIKHWFANCCYCTSLN